MPYIEEKHQKHQQVTPDGYELQWCYSSLTVFGGFHDREDYIVLMANVGNHTERVQWLLAPATAVVHRPNMKNIPRVTACTEVHLTIQCNVDAMNGEGGPLK